MKIDSVKVEMFQFRIIVRGTLHWTSPCDGSFALHLFFYHETHYLFLLFSLDLAEARPPNRATRLLVPFEAHASPTHFLFFSGMIFNVGN